MATNTPWGKSQQATKVQRGLTFHSTSGHGGFLISKGYAEKHLSQAAIKKALIFGNYYAFEEDCAASIVAYEIPESQKVFNSITEQSLLASLSRWYPDYLIERGVTPQTEGYAEWLISQEDDKLRAEKSPNLIVSAIKFNDTATKVWTADGKEHLVTAESYARRQRLNLLSNCELL